MKCILLFLLLPVSCFAQLNICTTYSAHATVNLTWSSGSKKITFIGDSINANNTSTPCIHLTGYDTVIIKHCKLLNSSTQAILLTNCKYNIVDSNYMYNVADGVHDNVSPYDAVPGRIFFRSNFIGNILGPFPLGNAIQLNQVHAGSMISNNYIVCIDSSGRHPQDLLSVYKCNGLPGDSIFVINNFVSGGQVNNDSGGAAGCVLNDVGGSIQVCRNNVFINPGAVGVQLQGGNGSTADHNFIYSDGHGLINFVGLSYGNYSGDTAYNNKMAYNRINWRKHDGSTSTKFVDAAITTSVSTASGLTGGPTLVTPNGWSTNTADGVRDMGVDPSLLPSPMLASCSVTLPPSITYSTPITIYLSTPVSLTASNTGGAAVSWSGSVPPGLSLNTSNGAITGTPTTLAGSTGYVITATNTAGSDPFTINITVSAVAPVDTTTGIRLHQGRVKLE